MSKQPVSKFNGTKPHHNTALLKYPFELVTGDPLKPDTRRVIGVIKTFEEGEELLRQEWAHRSSDPKNKVSFEMFCDLSAQSKLREAFKYMNRVRAEEEEREEAFEEAEALKAKREDGRHVRKKRRLASEREEWAKGKIAELDQLFEDFAELTEKYHALRALDDGSEVAITAKAYSQLARMSQELKDFGDTAKRLAEAMRAHHFATTHSRHFAPTIGDA